MRADLADETGLTNLGRVPKGMSFLDATISLRGQRKFTVDYYAKGDRMTLCDTLRHMRRIVDAMPAGEDRSALCEYIDAAIDYGKRMDSRMKQLKAMISD